MIDVNTKKQAILIKRQAQAFTKTVPETARIIRTDINNIRWLINKGYIKTLKLGDTKVPIEEIHRFIKYSIDNNIDWNELIAEDRQKGKKVTL